MSRIFSHELLMRFSLVTTTIGHSDILRQQARIRLISNNFVGLSLGKLIMMKFLTRKIV